MIHVYKLEVTPDHKKLGLKILIGHAVSYFDRFPTRSSILRAFARSERSRITRFDRKCMGPELADRTQKENIIFYKAVKSVLNEINIPKDAFKTPKWSKKELSELSPGERAIGAISIGGKDGRLMLSRIRVWSGK